MISPAFNPFAFASLDTATKRFALSEEAVPTTKISLAPFCLHVSAN